MSPAVIGIDAGAREYEILQDGRQSIVDSGRETGRKRSMASAELTEIMQRAERLDADEQLQLIAYVANLARRGADGSPVRRSWLEIAGTAPYPLLGEDAQAWVSRTRRESDERRERGREGKR